MNKRIFKNETSSNGDVPFFKIGTFGKKADSYISNAKFNEYKNKYSYPKIGDVLISASGTLGRTVVYDGSRAYYQDSNIVWLETYGKIDNRFLLQYYHTLHWNKAEGGTIKRLYNKDILGLSITLPTIEEQKCIGIFFQKLDYLIQLQQQKLDKLKQLKQGYLQKMFPVNKDIVPRIRFSGFDKDWIGVSLFELIEYENSHHTYSEIKKYKHGNYPVFDAIGEISRISQFDQSKKYISIIKDGSGVGKTTLRQSKSSIIGTMGYLKPKNVYIYFMNYLIETIDFKKYIIGSSIPHIYFKDYSKMAVHIPEINEQKKIGLFFKNLDDDLDKNNNRLIVLDLLKKGYLQKMFC